MSIKVHMTKVPFHALFALEDTGIKEAVLKRRVLCVEIGREGYW